MSNPYSGADFWGFFKIFFTRLFTLDFPLASDEVQIFVLMGVAITGSFLGTFLVLRNMTMVANALSHTILVGIVGAYLLLFSSGTLQESISLVHLTVAALIAGLLTTALIEFLNKVTSLQEDSAVGLVFTSLFALGILLVTLFTKNLHMGTELVTGNVDAVTRDDLKIVFGALAMSVGLLLLFFKEFKLTTFDANLASLQGFSPAFFNALLMIMTAACIMSALRAVGVLMVLAFFVGPTLIARMLTNSLQVLLFLGCLIGVVASIVGVAISRHILTTQHFGLSTGGLVVCLLMIGFILVAFIRKRVVVDI